MGVTRWIRTYYDEDDTWSYVELDDQEWALRQVDLRGPDRRPVTAAALSEILDLRDRLGVSGVRAYERKYGILAECSLDGWEETDGACEIIADVFEQLWTDARAHLDSAGDAAVGAL